MKCVRRAEPPSSPGAADRLLRTGGCQAPELRLNLRAREEARRRAPPARAASAALLGAGISIIHMLSALELCVAGGNILGAGQRHRDSLLSARAGSNNDLDDGLASSGGVLSAHLGALLQPGGGRQQLRAHSLQRPGGAPCQLPPTWVGKWYHQANKEQVRVTNAEISDKGVCRDKKGDKYLFELARAQQPACLVCLVINERHLNVLQYKESSCQPVRGANSTPAGAVGAHDQHALLDAVCSDITGDAQLESLFRLDTPPIECPIAGKFDFAYDNCREPRSSLDSCLDAKQLNFKFAACADAPGSESKTEQLKCYADWSEGNNYYMIGRLHAASNPADVGKFRCFVYEKSPDGDGHYQMAQSLEESCYGLINAYEGPKTLRLEPRKQQQNKCHFPSFIWAQSDNWLSVDSSLIYMFGANATKYQVKETREGTVIEEAACLQQLTVASGARVGAQAMQPSGARRFPPSSPNHAAQVHAHAADQAPQAAAAAPKAPPSDAVYLIQITKNCQTTDYCARFYRRTSGIVQIDYFAALAGSDVAQRCRSAFAGAPQTQIITSTSLEQQRCPFDGAYTIEASSESDLSFNPSNIFICPRQSFLTAQCEQPSRMRIHSKCGAQIAGAQAQAAAARPLVKNLYCLGSWSSNGLVRLLLADDERQRYSAWYRDYGAPPLLAGDEPAPPAPQPPPASVLDLQLALITPMPTIAKPMQVRLTRRAQCADIRNYLATGHANWPGPGQSSNLPLSSAGAATGYASPAAPRSPPANSLVNAILVIIVSLFMLNAARLGTSTAAAAQPGASLRQTSIRGTARS